MDRFFMKKFKVRIQSYIFRPEDFKGVFVDFLTVHKEFWKEHLTFRLTVPAQIQMRLGTRDCAPETEASVL